MKLRSRAVRIAIGLCLAVLVTLIVADRLVSSRSRDILAVNHVQTTEKVVALTYDDGPHSTYTPQLLQILAKYRVHATFFMVGKRVEMYPQIARDVVKAGHAVGNHTYTHPNREGPIARNRLVWELSKCEKAIMKATNQQTYLWRPPKGFIDREVLTTAAANGYKTILWDVSAYHHRAPSPQQMAQFVLNHVHPGSIILAHDGMYEMRWRDVAATPLIIEGLRKQGYRFVTVPELLEIGAKGQRAEGREQR